jgi:hypothetical protein
MARRQHTHPCAYAPRCHTLVACGGALERNHDGWPDVVCDGYHGADGRTYPSLCAECEDAMCVACGQNVRIDGHSFDCTQILVGDLVELEDGPGVRRAS